MYRAEINLKKALASEDYEKACINKAIITEMGKAVRELEEVLKCTNKLD